MKNKRDKIKILFIILSLAFSFKTQAFSFSDFLNMFKESNVEKEKEIKKETNNIEKEDKKENKKNIDENIYNNLDSDEKKVLLVIDDIYNGIINIDVDRVRKNVNFDISSNNIDNFNKFLDSDETIKDDLKYILSHLDYEVVDVLKDGAKFKAKLKIEFIDIKSAFLDSIPSIVLKNGINILKGKIDNNVISSIIKTMKKTIKNNKYDQIKFDYKFTFVDNGSVLKLYGVNDIINDIIRYIEGIIRDLSVLQ